MRYFIILLWLAFLTVFVCTTAFKIDNIENAITEISSFISLTSKNFRIVMDSLRTQIQFNNSVKEHIISHYR